MIETTLDGKTKNIVQENIEQLKQLFPEIITENKIDFDKLREILGEEIDDSNERYDFKWKGKHEATKIALNPSEGTLRPDKESSKNWDTTENLYIEGDNLEVLKLLQKSYYNKIKCIYIDPPYNTGNDLLYKNDFVDNLEYYLSLTNQSKDGFKLLSNTESNGRFHSDWISFMYSRLKLARNLICEDGGIVISIDHHELSNLINICDEIFGQHNRIGIVTVVHKPEGRNQEKYFASSNEFALFYAKNKDKLNFNPIIIDEEYLQTFDKKDEISRYRYNNFIRLGGGNANKRENKPNFWYPIYISKDLKKLSLEYHEGWFEKYPKTKKQERTWKTKSETFLELYENNNIVADFDKNGDIQIYEKYRISKGQLVKTHWINKKYNAIYNGTKVLEKLMDDKTFDFPKSIYLIEDIIKLFSSDDDIILDFFSGSATTAHAVFNINYENNSKLQFILVQLPEECNEKSNALKAGYTNICEIGKERIRRAGEKLLDEHPDANIDIGFKVFKLDSSNLTKWNPDIDNLEYSLMNVRDNLVESRTELDLVYEIILKYGLELTLPVEKIESGGYAFYSVGMGSLVVCLNNHIQRNVAESVLKIKEKFSPSIMRVVFKDNGFESDSDKTNVKEILRNNEIDEFVTI